MRDEPPHDRVAVVTGASSGIGRATAHLLAEQGWRLVLASRSAQALEATRQECMGRGATQVLVQVTDVGRREQVDALLARAVHDLGRVDAVVHSAAVLAYGRFQDVPADVFDAVLTTNVTGSANVARAALCRFDAQGGGSLVVVGSVVGKIAPPYMSTYVTSKWALQGLVRTLQIETRDRRGTHVSLVSPGGVDTPIYDQAGSYAGRGGHPPPPVSRPETVAEAVVAAIDKPVRERAVGPANALMVLGFRVLPSVFDALVAPLMRQLGLGRREVAAGPGNVIDPQPGLEAVHGRWPHVWG